MNFTIYLTAIGNSFHRFSLESSSKKFSKQAENHEQPRSNALFTLWRVLVVLKYEIVIPA